MTNFSLFFFSTLEALLPHVHSYAFSWVHLNDAFVFIYLFTYLFWGRGVHMLLLRKYTCSLRTFFFPLASAIAHCCTPQSFTQLASCCSVFCSYARDSLRKWRQCQLQGNPLKKVLPRWDTRSAIFFAVAWHSSLWLGPEGLFYIVWQPVGASDICVAQKPTIEGKEQKEWEKEQHWLVAFEAWDAVGRLGTAEGSLS